MAENAAGVIAGCSGSMMNLKADVRPPSVEATPVDWRLGGKERVSTASLKDRDLAALLTVDGAPDLYAAGEGR